MKIKCPIPSCGHEWEMKSPQHARAGAEGGRRKRTEREKRQIARKLRAFARKQRGKGLRMWRGKWLKTGDIPQVVK